MKVADIMTSGAAAVRPETSLADAVNIMIQHHISGLPVTDPDALRQIREILIAERILVPESATSETTA